jgi:hypothetical protein
VASNNAAASLLRLTWFANSFIVVSLPWLDKADATTEVVNKNV